MDRRLQNRYGTLVRQQLQAAQALAAGLKSLPSVTHSFAVTQAAWRFLANPRVTLAHLIEPLRDVARQTLAASPASHVLLVHDWSFLAFPTHTGKTDRVSAGPAFAFGYDLATALLVDAATGNPLTPMELELTTATGVCSTRNDRPEPAAHIDQVFATMQASRSWNLTKPVVHVIDHEADGLAPFREWSAAGHTFVVRVDAKRRVTWQGESVLLPAVVARLQDSGAFQRTGTLDTGARVFAAETTITYDQPGRVRRGSRRVTVPGEPLTVRLIATQLRDGTGTVMAEWLLVTNAGEAVTKAQVSQWYAWRWRIESFFKLLKGHGHQVESWEQESGRAIAKRLAVTAMACGLVWRLERDRTPAGQTLARLLIRLSGRQRKRSRPVTAPALLAGLEKLIAVLDLLDETTPDELAAR